MSDDYGYGWLAGVVPAGARRFRVSDPGLAATLRDAGAELVEDAPDVEIAPSGGLRGDATLGLVAISPRPALPGSRLVRAGLRAGGAIRTRALAELARRRLRRSGYAQTAILGWDFAHAADLPGFPVRRDRLAERLPQRALALGRRGAPEPTALQDALTAAAGEAGLDLRAEWASVRSGTVIVVADQAVLRAAVGPARVQLERQADALAALAAGVLPESVSNRLPQLLARGRAGLADWTLERRLAGARPPRELTPALLEDCVAFLVGLHRAPGGAEGGRSPADDAETVAAVCGPEEAAAVRALAARVESELADVPRGFAHGDFFAGNLLATGDGLSGVLDWDAAGPGRLPATDLFHLQLTGSPYGADEDWGRAVLERILPSARSGGDDAVRRYCRELGFEPDPAVLEPLALAYWLGYAAYQLRTHGHRRHQPSWLERNLSLVLRDPATRRSAPAAARGAPSRAA
jgi:aminoglycoside phosphotransferase (APT) family kinase protein